MRCACASPRAKLRRVSGIGFSDKYVVFMNAIDCAAVVLLICALCWNNNVAHKYNVNELSLCCS